MVKDKAVVLDDIDESDEDEVTSNKLLIPVVGNWYITSNTRNWVLQKKGNTPDKNGKVQWNDRMYFSSLEGVLREAVSLKLKKSEASTVDELLANLKEIRADLSKRIGEV